jgi:sortase A
MRRISWLLIVIGLLMTGYGVYNYSLSRLGQEEAQQQFAKEEEPVPPKVPAPPLYDPYKPGDPVAKLSIPRLDKTLYVIEGTDQGSLKKGPGHMPGTALPGAAGNCVIAGHRDTHFRMLSEVQVGDEVDLDTRYGTFKYHIRSMHVVLPTNVSSLKPTRDPELHLITCYPFYFVGHAPKRMVIEAVMDKPGTENAVSENYRKPKPTL